MLAPGSDVRALAAPKKNTLYQESTRCSPAVANRCLPATPCNQPLRTLSHANSQKPETRCRPAPANRHGPDRSFPCCTYTGYILIRPHIDTALHDVRHIDTTLHDVASSRLGIFAERIRLQPPANSSLRLSRPRSLPISCSYSCSRAEAARDSTGKLSHSRPN
jgi:hypothetical protein